MKSNIKFLLFAVSIFSAIGLYSCDENATIDVPGPEVDFTFNYSDINAIGAPAQRSISIWQKVASDTIPGEDVVSFLESDSANSKYAEAIVAATLKKCKLTVSGGNFNFNGVDSVKIVYHHVSTPTTVFELVVGAPSATENTVINFNNIKISKDEALAMISQDKVASMWVKVNPMIRPNCFAAGAVYNFSAESWISVKASSALSGGLGL
jgi:hypothetical protein